MVETHILDIIAELKKPNLAPATKAFLEADLARWIALYPPVDRQKEEASPATEIFYRDAGPDS